jgi:AAA domain/PLD-like domain
MLRKRAGLHPLWMRLCSPLKAVESQRANLLHRAAVALGYLGMDAPVPASRVAVHDAVDAVFAARITALGSEAASMRAAARIQQEAATAAQGEADRIRADLSAWATADAEVRAWMAGWTDAHATDHVDAMQRRLDVEERALAFDLAMRLREAEFLAHAKEWKSDWAQGKLTKAKYLRVRLLRAISLLTPCVVCTVYKAASYGCFFDRQAQADRPLSLPIDLLIYDEAGQVLPDHGLPLLGLARQAVAVGDIHQLEPIALFSDIADTALMSAAGADREACDELQCMGLDHAGGSVMRLFQAVTAYSEDQAALPGIMLRHHFRCVPRVIAYCNELVYRGQLVPVRGPVESPSVPPMAWAHLRGDSQRAGPSWTNAPEAEAIARWTARCRVAIEAEHGKFIEDLVAVITPYRAQQRVLQTALSKHLGSTAEGMIVGTVHALQGAQKRIVVFSPTITWASVVATGIRPFFDISTNMLNVAVSRAQDAFVVIGDMALFDAHPSAGFTPAAVLARHLHRCDDSELRDVISGLVAAHPDARFDRIEGLPPHQAILAEAFRSAQRRILLASPFLAAAPMKADRVLTMVSNAVKRGVDVIIYTGLTVSTDLDGKRVEALQRELAAAGAQVHVTTRVHAKTLVVDDMLAVEGSFNWFSASRDPRLARKDSSVALRGSNVAAIVKQIEAEFAALRTTPI